MRLEEQVGRGIYRHRGARNVNDLSQSIAHHLHIDLMDYDYEDGIADLVESILWCYRGYIDLGGICFYYDRKVPGKESGKIVKDGQGKVRVVRRDAGTEPGNLPEV